MSVLPYYDNVHNIQLTDQYIDKLDNTNLYKGNIKWTVDFLNGTGQQETTKVSTCTRLGQARYH